MGSSPDLYLLLISAPFGALEVTLRPQPSRLNWLWFIQKNDIIETREIADGSSSTAMLRGGGRRTAFRQGSAATRNVALGAWSLHPASRRGSWHPADDAHH